MGVMMNDIVSRLREQAGNRSGKAHFMSDGSIRWFPVLDEAADEIIKLRADLAAKDEAIRYGIQALAAAEDAHEEARAELAAAHGNADDNYKKLMETRAELAAARELLMFARWVAIGAGDNAFAARIDAFLKGDGDE